MTTARNPDVTIVLLLKGRDAFTVRWFEYAAAREIPFKVLVADGGHDEGLAKTLRDRRFHEKVDYEYVRFPFDDSHRRFYEKCAAALDRVTTPFALFASNDDFYLFDSVAASARYLRQNPACVATRGEIWDFDVAKRSGWWGFHVKDHVYGDLGGYRRLYFHPAVEGATALERVADLSKKFHSVWHEVVRTDAIRDAFRDYLRYRIDDFRFFELFLTFHVATRGRMHRTPELHMLHQVQPDSAAVTIVGDPVGHWLRTKTWDAEFDQVIDGLAKQLAAVDRIDFEKAARELTRLYFLNVMLKPLVAEGAPARECPAAKLKRGLKGLVTGNALAFNVLKKLKLLLRPESRALPAAFEAPVSDVESFMRTVRQGAKR